jgi:acyl dehydratase
MDVAIELLFISLDTYVNETVHYFYRVSFDRQP